MMPSRRITTLFVVLVSAATLLTSASAFAQQGAGAEEDNSEATVREKKDGQPNSGRILVDYSGRLQDQKGTPISGIFHLEFNLYEGENAAEPVWKERQYVAVIDGTYTVPLGRNSSLKRAAIDGKRWIGIELVGEGEIVRDRLKIRESKDDGSGAQFDNAVSSETQKLLKKASNSDNVVFANVAERAVKADKADVAKKALTVGSLSAEEIEKLADDALKRLSSHIANPNAHGVGGSTLSNQPRIMEQIGGPGGGSYRSECPEGWVVTGIKGGAGRVVDSLAIICRQLQ